MKNELHVPKQPFFNIKIKNEKPILAVARFFLQLQKASSKTSFGLNKFYLTITSSLQILTLLGFIFRFSKWNWKTKIEIISIYGDLKSTDLSMNMSSLLTIQQDTSFLKRSMNTEFSVTPYQRLDKILLNVSSDMISNETVSAAGQNEFLYRKRPTLCQRFAEMRSSRHNVEIHSYYIVLGYELKPIFAVKTSWNMDHVDVNLIRQLVSVEKTLVHRLVITWRLYILILEDSQNVP